MSFVSFPVQQTFQTVVKEISPNIPVIDAKYGAKVLVGGMRASITVTLDNIFYAQNPAQVLTIADDAFGFAAWAQLGVSEWVDAVNGGPAGDITYYGYWAGKGIDQHYASCALDEQYFFIDGIRIDDDIVVSPQEINQMIPDLDQLLVLPWDKVWTDGVNILDEDEALWFGGEIGKGVVEIGNSDPFISGIFSVEGPGKGWSVMPLCMPGQDPDQTYDYPLALYNALAFEALVARGTA